MPSPEVSPDGSLTASEYSLPAPEDTLLTTDEHGSVLKAIRTGKQQRDWLQVRGCVGAEKKDLLIWVETLMSRIQLREDP